MDSELHEVVSRILMDRIRNQPDEPCLAYNELCLEVARISDITLPVLDAETEWKAHPLAPVFENLDRDDALANRPFRTALVARNSADGPTLPGLGFWEARARLTGKKTPRGFVGKVQEWMQEVHDLTVYWRNR